MSELTRKAMQTTYQPPRGRAKDEAVSIDPVRNRAPESINITFDHLRGSLRKL